MDLNQSDWKSQCDNNENSIIIDVRAEYEIADGIIPNAINIDIYGGQLFIDEINKLDKSKSYFLYCKAGSRSSQACSIMNQLGFDKTYNLLGGFMNWNGKKAII